MQTSIIVLWALADTIGPASRLVQIDTALYTLSIYIQYRLKDKMPIRLRVINMNHSPGKILLSFLLLMLLNGQVNAGEIARDTFDRALGRIFRNRTGVTPTWVLVLRQVQA